MSGERINRFRLIQGGKSEKTESSGDSNGLNQMMTDLGIHESSTKEAVAIAIGNFLKKRGGDSTWDRATQKMRITNYGNVLEGVRTTINQLESKFDI